MIAIIDYGMGNLRSVQKGCEKMGYPAEITRDAARIEAAAGVILPGVGAFGACMDGLAACRLIDTVHRVAAAGTPLLGICVGMQILFSESHEFGRVRGLDILKGTVERFDPTRLISDDGPHKIPHMGWNQLHIERSAPHLAHVPVARPCILFTPTIRSRQTRPLLPPPPSTAFHLPQASGRTLSLPPSFTPKRARRSACKSWPTLANL